jgi:hypothetical protein
MTKNSFVGSIGCVLLAAVAGAAAGPGEDVRFNRDVRPILSENCFSCHGPDAARRKAGLRLDTREGATAALEGGAAVVPGDPAASLLLQRVTSTEHGGRMPPPRTGRKLTPGQVEVLRRWVHAGAPYQRHWSLIPPERPALPPADGAWPRNPIDHFVLARLEQEGLRPAPEAARATLLRRVTLDLTGLPPTPLEQDAFLADPSPAAYEKMVDRLLASPAYGERMAQVWLDLARYADTNGYNNDEERTMWAWRDWVIDAFNDNLPYDRFVTDQIAGDLLPGATPQQKLATGFNRNHVITTEGGIIPEEYRLEYVADRVHTTAGAFLGLSLGCARCHDHKYDPISQKDYYRFFAFFNNIQDRTIGYNQGAAAEPYLRLPSRRQQAILDELEARRRDLEELRRRREAAADDAAARWESGLSAADRARFASAAPLAHLALDEGKGTEIHDSANVSLRGTVQGNVKWAEGKAGRALEFDGQTHVELPGVGDFERTDAFSAGAWIHLATGEPATVLSRMDDANAFRGYDLILEQGRAAVHVIHRFPESAIKVITKEPVGLNAWHHVLLTHDGSGKAAGVKVYFDGKPQALEVKFDTLGGTIRTDKPFRVGRRTPGAPFRGRIDDVRLYGLALGAEDAAHLAGGQAPGGLAEVLKVPAAQRTAAQRDQVRRAYLEKADEEYRRLKGELESVARRKAAVELGVPTTMVMQELSAPRPTHVLKRGQYDQPGEKVEPAVPGCLPALPTGVPANRLGLARWLVDPANPLTARVAVNRWWQTYFGTGIVETAEDFGSQGSWPSHPELLDWLATELVRSGWDVKGLQRLLVTSAAYRQSSRATPELLERDPGNRLLARGPRFRLPAETVRDNALAVAGLLVRRVGGPSVKPYQPAGLWEDVSVERRVVYKPDTGADLYRRSLYTYWKRTCPPPALTAFDAPDRETCVIRRARTNTPLQALVLLNDPTHVEAARKLAERALREGGTSPESRLAHAYRLAVARPPRPEETSVLLPILRRALDRFRGDSKAAERLLGVGASPRDPGMDASELAAWSAVASVLLNLDETITKE